MHVHTHGIVLSILHQETKEPLPKEEVAAIWENCKDHGLLLGTGGEYSNVSLHDIRSRVSTTTSMSCIHELWSVRLIQMRKRILHVVLCQHHTESAFVPFSCHYVSIHMYIKLWY